MAITLNGSTIQISGGIATGAAISATANTLFAAVDFTGHADRILYITGGTGAGQSRGIRVASGNTLTIWGTWDTIPDATSTFTISHDVTDLTAIAGVTYVGPSTSKTVQYLTGNIQVLSGGVFGGLRNTIILGENFRPLVNSGGLWQFGYQIGDEGAQGGSIIMSYQGTQYLDWTMEGRVRMYGSDWVINMQAAGGGLARLNTTSDGQELTLIGCRFQDLVPHESSISTIVNCTFHGPRGGFFTKNTPIRSSGNKVFSGLLSIRTTEGNPNGVDFFDLSYFGQNPNFAIFTAPVFLFQYSRPDGVAYYWNTAFPSGFENAFTWFANTGTGVIYEGYSVKPVVRNAAGDALENVNIALIDKAGNAGWTTAKNGTFDPVKTLNLVTDANGTVTSAIGTNENGLVVRSVWSRLNATTSQATNYFPFTLRVRRYGYSFLSKSVDYTARTEEPVGLAVNVLVTQTDSDLVAAYTTLETSAKFYDYSQYWLSLAANMTVAETITRSGSLIDAGAYNVTIDATAGAVFSVSGNTITIKASTYTGDMTTTGIITLTNGAEFIGTRTDANGTVAPPKTVSVTGITAGSRLQIYNVTTATEIVNDVVSGTSYSATYNEGAGYTTGDTVRVRLAYAGASSAKLPYTAQAIAGASGWSILASQQADDVYAAFGIDGATVTEYVADFPNVQIDINDPDGATRVDRLYAWFVYTQASDEDGIRQWFGGIVPEDEANFRIVTSVLDLKIDNASATGVAFVDGRRLYRDDGASPLVASTTGGGSIAMFAGKVYTSVVSTASPVITGDIADIPTPAQNAAAVLSATVEGTVTVAQAQRLLLAQAAGNATGLETGEGVTFKSLDGTKTRIAGNVSSGVRNIILVDGT